MANKFITDNFVESLENMFLMFSTAYFLVGVLRYHINDMADLVDGVQKE